MCNLNLKFCEQMKRDLEINGLCNRYNQHLWIQEKLHFVKERKPQSSLNSLFGEA